MLNKTIKLNKKKGRLLTGFTLQNFSKKNLGGFTAIEAIIAIFVLTVAVIGVYSSFSGMAISTSILSSRLIASYLTKEGIEIVRNIRDGNWLEQGTNPDNPWNEGLTGCAAGCEADYTISVEDPLLPSYAGRFLYIDGTNKFYKYIDSPGPTDSKTKFQRKITIDDSASDVLKVTVSVKWEEKGEPYNFSAEEYLYDWY